MAGRFIDDQIQQSPGFTVDEAFAAYLASEPFAASRERLFPLMISEPDSRRFDATRVDTTA